MTLGEIIGGKYQEWMMLMGEVEMKKEEMRVLRKKKGGERKDKETKLNFFGR